MSIRVRPEVAQCLAVVLLPALLTLPRFWNGFVFDDVYVIVRSDFIHQLSNLPRAFSSHAMVASSLENLFDNVPVDTYRPVSIASFFWDAQLSGREPWAYHLTNTALHAGNCVLVLELLKRLCPHSHAALRLGLALCFGLAPWLSEAHVFINGRSDLWLALFASAAILVQQSALERASWWRACTAAALSLLALLSKENAVLMLPFLVLTPTSVTVSLGRRARLGLPVVAAFVLYVAARSAALDGLRTHAGGAHLIRALSNLPLLWADAVFHSLLPVPYVLRNLRDDYLALGHVTRAAAWLFFVLTLVAIPLCVRGRRATVGWALGLALCTLAPAAIITTELWQGFGRFLYLPSVGLFVAACELLTTLGSSSARARLLLQRSVFALAAFSGVLLLDSTLGFADDLTLYERARAQSPEQGWVHGSVGLARKRLGQCDQAIPLLERADSMAPREPRYLHNLALCWLEVGDRAAAQRAAQIGQLRFRGLQEQEQFRRVEQTALSP